MTAFIDLTRSPPAPARALSTALDTATLLTRFGLAPHLVAHWVLDGTGRPACVWREDIVPHRPSVARGIGVRKPNEGGT